MTAASLRTLALLAAAVLLPTVLSAAGVEYYIAFAARVLIFALAASSLNFVVGYGGMVAFGHAAFFGLGAYTVAVLAQAGLTAAWIAWPLAVAVAAAAALVVGAISLRTHGVYFIMITLAFAQMLYYLVIAVDTWGGDDGLPLAERSTLAPFDIGSDSGIYYVALTLLAAALYALGRVAASRYGRVLAGLRQNETRMEALGYPVLSLKLACFVLGGAVAGLAGALFVNLNGLATPGLLYWTQSGMLLVMAILGGIGRRYGGLLGAAALLGLEEALAGVTEHPQLFVGLALIAVVLFAPRGLAGLLADKRHD